MAKRAVQGPVFRQSPAGESFPKIYPHITLASLPLSAANDLDAIRASIPTLENPLSLKFASVEIGSHYYRSVYVAIRLTREVANLHMRVHDSLKLEPQTPAFPHLSLCYVDEADAAKGERRAYYDDLAQDAVRFGEDCVRLNCGSGGGEDWMDGFEAQEIWVVQCEGPVEDWPILQKIPLVWKEYSS
ncbi:2',3'-cyclic-nucleotide 3'-phosphodiesterase [Crassisporium funariophilum]|nr:2',3'-cyclic-nucleotide 3'-phosphodiesterase [Crassisporium funariophilum]